MKNVNLTKNGPLLYRAPYVVPVATPLIEDGGVLVAAGRIVAVDCFSRLRQESARVVELDGRILTPALINCHAHLELSHLAALGQELTLRGHKQYSAQTDMSPSVPVLSPLTRPSATLSPLGRGDVAFFPSPPGRRCPKGADEGKLGVVESHETFLQPSGDITDWIRTLLAQRAGNNLPAEVIIKAGHAALAAQHRRGVALVADIGNQATSRTIGQGCAAECLFFLELLGLTEQAARATLAALPVDVQCAVHAPYSCHPFLIREVKERARQVGRLFPIHVAESAAEIEFLQTGTGPFHDFLTERLRLARALAAGQALTDLVSIPGCGAVEYLNELGVLDGRTICVHAVHISDHEADLLAETKAKVCLCPGSNRRLGVGTAKVPGFLQRRMLPGLGTDSLASNERLDLWHEMMLLQEDHPSVDPELIFSMATKGGAETLGVDQRLGTLAPGREAKLLAIAFSGPAAEVYQHLVNADQAITVDWLEANHAN